jgi:mannosyltransferase OCH1-like enzyme
MLLIQYWHTEEIPDYVAESSESFRAHNPGLDHRIFNEASAEAFIADNFSPREVAAFRAVVPPSTQANYLRYCAVLTLGGIYSDTDFGCVGPLNSLQAETEGGTLFYKRDRDVVVNNFFAFRSPGHPFLRLALDIATARIERRDPSDNSWRLCGPRIFTYMYRLFRAGSVEAFMTEFGERSERARNYSEFLEGVFGEYSRITEAFDGIRLLPVEEMKEWVVPAAAPHKKTSMHWTKWQGSIFR